MGVVRLSHSWCQVRSFGVASRKNEPLHLRIYLFFCLFSFSEFGMRCRCQADCWGLIWGGRGDSPCGRRLEVGFHKWKCCFNYHGFVILSVKILEKGGRVSWLLPICPDSICSCNSISAVKLSMDCLRVLLFPAVVFHHLHSCLFHNKLHASTGCSQADQKVTQWSRSCWRGVPLSTVDWSADFELGNDELRWRVNSSETVKWVQCPSGASFSDYNHRQSK